MQRIVCYVELNGDFVRQSFCQTVQQCATAGQVDSSLDDIGVQLRRSGLQRLKNSTLSYKLPINNTYIQGITVWGNATNVFTLTRYLGTDPEFSMGNSVISQGIDAGWVSQGRTVNVGVKINL